MYKVHLLIYLILSKQKTRGEKQIRKRIMKQPMRWQARWCSWSIVTFNASLVFIYIAYRYIGIDADIVYENPISLQHKFVF